MGIFSIKKSGDTIDFTKGVKIKKEVKSPAITSEGYIDLNNSHLPKNDSALQQTDNSGFFDFFSEPQKEQTNLSTNTSSGISSISPHSNFSQNNSEVDDIKKMLKRTTLGIETNSNEIYRLMQRIELLERKIEKFENRGF
jgi:hypothetical protein